jgi:hypothetical protein
MKTNKCVLALLAIYIFPLIISATIGIIWFLLKRKKNFSKNESSLINIFLIITVITFFSGLINGEGIDYYFFRTIYYYYQLIGVLLLGLYFRNKYSIKYFLKNIALCGTLITIFLYYDFIISFDWLTSPFSIFNRYKYGLNSEYAAITFLIAQIPGIKLNKILYRLSILLILLSLSRTYLVILFVTLFYKFFKNKISVKNMVIVFTALTSLIFLNIDSSKFSYASNPTEANITQKLGYSLKELTPTEATTIVDANANYRGFEAFLGVNEVYKSGSIFKALFGLGAGATISVDFFDSKAQNMSFFHNGFVTIFYHSGFVGLFLFILFLYKIFVISKSFGRVFSLGLMSFIFIYTLTSMGFISPIANYLLILLISISNYSDLNKTSKLM